MAWSVQGLPPDGGFRGATIRRATRASRARAFRRKANHARPRGRTTGGKRCLARKAKKVGTTPVDGGRRCGDLRGGPGVDFGCGPDPRARTTRPLPRRRDTAPSGGGERIFPRRAQSCGSHSRDGRSPVPSAARRHRVLALTGIPLRRRPQRDGRVGAIAPRELAARANRRHAPWLAHEQRVRNRQRSMCRHPVDQPLRSASRALGGSKPTAFRRRIGRVRSGALQRTDSRRTRGRPPLPANHRPRTRALGTRGRHGSRHAATLARHRAVALAAGRLTPTATWRAGEEPSSPSCGSPLRVLRWLRLLRLPREERPSRRGGS